MALVRFDPVRDVMRSMMDFRTDIDRLFGDVLGRRAAAPAEEQAAIWAPAMEMSETEKEVVVKASLPGVNKENLKLEVMGDRLSLQAEVRRETKEEKENLLAQEIFYGTFARAVQLPCEVQSEKAKAELKNGILTVYLPKSEQHVSKAIPIELK
jgi:HSP20 family protein